MFWFFVLCLTIAVAVIAIVRLREAAPAAPQAPPAKPLDVMTLDLPANGTEIFTPRALLQGRVYSITITGTFRYGTGGWFGRDADAAYYCDELGDYTQPHAGVEINGQRASRGELIDWAENRPLHKFTCSIDGAGEPVQLRVARSVKHGVNGGSLTVALELLPEGTIPVDLRRLARDGAALAAQEQAAELARIEQERERLEQERERQRDEETRRLKEHLARKAARKKAEAEAAQRAATEAERLRLEALRQDQELDREVAQLRRMVHLNRQVYDRRFQKAYVRKHQNEIRRTLAAKWSADYEAVMGNEQLRNRLEEQAPEVLSWFEARQDMAIEAERLAVLRQSGRAVPLTPSASESVREVITELYRTQDARDAVERSTATQPDTRSLDSLSAAITTGLSQLDRYGIVADSPEAAEQQFLRMVAERPVKSVYEQVRDKLAAGESAGLDIISERVKDLFREQVILVAQRRHAIRQQLWQEQRAAEERLANCRGEFAQWVDLLRAHGHNIDFNNSEQEASLEDGILGLAKQRRRVQEVLREMGDEESAEYVGALYAEKVADLFKAESETYA